MPRALRPTLFALVFASSCDAPKHQAPHAYPPIVAPAVAGPPPATPSASAPSLVASTPEPAPPSPPRPAEVERLDLPGQPPVSLVRSSDGGPPRIVFFPGICSNAYAYLLGFPEAARSHGGAIALEGDRPCGAASGFRSITSDPAHEEPRIDAALRAAGVVSPETADLVYVGYSLGATLVENLVRKSPERYRRVVLIASPRDPRLDRLKGAQAVATLSCSLDVPGRMKGAVRMLKNAGIASKYFEMPGCTHGNLADGERVLDEVFGWIEASARLLLPPARAPLAGGRLIGHPPCSTGHKG